MKQRCSKSKTNTRIANFLPIKVINSNNKLLLYIINNKNKNFQNLQYKYEMRE